jgi:two-component system, OmpR family, phosphate regulon response regulator OmpR
MTTPIVDASGQPAHILIVDDDDRIRELLKKYLTKGGARVSAAADAEAARKLLASFEFDVLILDVTMPKEDGFSLAASIRKTSQVPIVMLTARGDLEDKMKGYGAGVDDYMAKPFEPDELAAKINAILRRAFSRRAQAMEAAVFGPFLFNVQRGELSKDGSTVKLTEAETSLLKVLALKSGDPISREELARKTGAGLERSIDVQVTRLRRKIEADPRTPVFLQTVRGVGYRLALD